MVLARIYGVGDFGNFALFSSYTAVLSILFSLKYDSAIISMKLDEREIVAKSYIILYGLLTLILLPGIFFVRNILYHAVLAAILISVFKVAFNFFLSTKNFAILVVSKISNSLLFLVLSIFISRFASDKNFGMINSYTISYTIVLLFLILMFKNKAVGFSTEEIIRVFKILKRYKNFPVYYLPQQILNELSNQMPTFFISFFFGSYYTGIFMMTVKLLSALPSMVASSISQIFYQQFAELYHKNKQPCMFFYKVYRKLMIIAPLLILFILFIIFLIEDHFLPKSWNGILYYSILMAPMVAIRFIGSIISSVVLVLGYQKKSFYLEVFHIATRFISLVISGVIYNFSLLLIMLTLSSLLITGYRLQWYKEIVNESKKGE
ncbi:Polysaccharide biosynthesis protein [Desulfurobacterium pacificum]|uniref:Polysaccharide biosynthesis protein n=1 Tax=Desulfurobacterium pacificum TaxID=240166 RepID=A0ABY1NPL2_9BACT|nr:oligosaccharide flippase family protein [Desulfurobacterium pacificum]SMP13990.1 Polysaccharide biosynthesis protein [Desulfurobacterium pacificum]